MPIKFVFVISPKTHILDLAGPDQVLFEAIFFKAPFELEYCTFSKEDACTASGLRFSNLKHYSEMVLKKGDYIFIPGMDTDVITGSHSPAMKDKLLANGFVPEGIPPADFSAFVSAEVDKWTKVAKDAGAKVD